MRIRTRLGVCGILFVMVIALFTQVVFSASKTVGVLTVATEDRPLQQVIRDYTPEFEKKTGIKINYVYYPSAELRSKIRLDAALGTGKFQVIYITEAGIPEHAAAAMVVPIKEYYPPEYDFSDFFVSVVGMLSFKGIPFAAPLNTESTWLWYRKDLFDKEGIAVPVTLDDYITVCQKFYRPPHMFGGVVRGDRGHGYNVWRWTQFFAACGGKYMEDGKYVFDKYIDEAVQATDYYMEIIKTSPPGGERYTYLDAWDSFNAGRVATFVAATAKYGVTEDPTQSLVAGKVGYAPPPYAKAPVASGGAHGYAISSVGCKTNEQRKIAAQFIGWATSREMELQRIIEGKGNINCSRSSTFETAESKAKFPVEHLQALADTFEITKQCTMPIPEWPEIGDYLGVILEELFTGMRTDIRSGLEEAAAHGRKVLGL